MGKQSISLRTPDDWPSSSFLQQSDCLSSELMDISMLYNVRTERRGHCCYQASVGMGELGISLGDPDDWALDVLGDILNSFGGRLFDRIRSREVKLAV